MNQYQFERVINRMEKRYGKIKKGREQEFESFLMPMELNLMNTHRAHPSANSLRMLEAVPLVFHEIEGRMTGQAADVSAFETEDNRPLKEALLMSFDPETNPEVSAAMEENGVGFDRTDEIFYMVPVKCMLRILDSVKMWQKNLGSDGYFHFLEEILGEAIGDTEKMNFFVLTSTPER